MLSQEYVHGPGIDNPWAYLEHDGASVLVRYYHADLLGSIRLITDGAGDVIQAYDLGAARPGIRLWRFAPTGRRPSFGETTECIFPFPFQPFQYAAREDDPDSKLDYNRARYYNPRAGRFISPDPLGAAGGRTNRFLYVGNSPTRFKDPSGMIGALAVVGLALVGGIIGAVIGAASTGTWQGAATGFGLGFFGAVVGIFLAQMGVFGFLAGAIGGILSGITSLGSMILGGILGAGQALVAELIPQLGVAGAAAVFLALSGLIAGRIALAKKFLLAPPQSTVPPTPWPAGWPFATPAYGDTLGMELELLDILADELVCT